MNNTKLPNTCLWISLVYQIISISNIKGIYNGSDANLWQYTPICEFATLVYCHIRIRKSKRQQLTELRAGLGILGVPLQHHMIGWSFYLWWKTQRNQLWSEKKKTLLFCRCVMFVWKNRETAVWRNILKCSRPMTLGKYWHENMKCLWNEALGWQVMRQWLSHDENQLAKTLNLFDFDLNTRCDIML